MRANKMALKTIFIFQGAAPAMTFCPENRPRKDSPQIEDIANRHGGHREEFRENLLSSSL